MDRLRGFDIKSGIIGFLLAALIAVCVGAGQQAGAPPVTPRYQIAVVGSVIYVLDNQTNKVSQVYGNDGEAEGQTDWVTLGAFSLEQALAKKGKIKR